MTSKHLPIALCLALGLAACGESNAPQTGTTAPGAPAPSAAPAAGDTAALKATADKLLADASQYVKDHKWELAEKGVTELEALKPKLPPEYGPRIDDLKKLLATAKTATAPGGIRLP
jgi:hypothetical protein